MTNDRENQLDSIWTEVRQLVLNDGPATESIDVMIERYGISPDDREALIAQVIAFHCAQATTLAVGPLQGLPPALIFAQWAKMEIAAEMRGE